jgi:hypothetical protein
MLFAFDLLLSSLCIGLHQPKEEREGVSACYLAIMLRGDDL